MKEARYKRIHAMQFCSHEVHNREKLIYAVGRLVRTLVNLVKEVTIRDYKGHVLFLDPRIGDTGVFSL